MGRRGEEDLAGPGPHPEEAVGGHGRDLLPARAERDIGDDVRRGRARVRELARGDGRRPPRLVVRVEQEYVRVVRLAEVRGEPEVPALRVAGRVQVPEVV